LADALLVTGPETGSAADAGRLRAVKKAVPDRPVLVASGITLDSADAFREADGFIIGSAFKRGGQAENPVEPARVRELVAKLRKFS
jgi:predicted TIM-barrel enzyme